MRRLGRLDEARRDVDAERGARPDELARAEAAADVEHAVALGGRERLHRRGAVQRERGDDQVLEVDGSGRRARRPRRAEASSFSGRTVAIAKSVRATGGRVHPRGARAGHRNRCQARTRAPGAVKIWSAASARHGSRPQAFRWLTALGSVARAASVSRPSAAVRRSRHRMKRYTGGTAWRRGNAAGADAYGLGSGVLVVRRRARACRTCHPRQRPRRRPAHCSSGKACCTWTVSRPAARSGNASSASRATTSAFSSAERARSVDPSSRRRLRISRPKSTCARAPAPVPITTSRP